MLKEWRRRGSLWLVLGLIPGEYESGVGVCASLGGFGCIGCWGRMEGGSRGHSSHRTNGRERSLLLARSFELLDFSFKMDRASRGSGPVSSTSRFLEARRRMRIGRRELHLKRGEGKEGGGSTSDLSRLIRLPSSITPATTTSWYWAAY